MKNFFSTFLIFIITSAWFTLANAATQELPYTIIDPPQVTETGNKIEVIEFFYYGCPHCYDLEPHIEAWLKKLPPDVAFRRIPAVFHDSWAPLATVFYSLDALGQLHRLHRSLFDAVQAGNIQPDEANLTAWINRHGGIDSKKFKEVYHSFAVQTKVMRAKQLVDAYKVTGVPAIVIDGRYLTSNVKAGSHEAVIPVIEQIIEKVRQERKKKK